MRWFTSCLGSSPSGQIVVLHGTFTLSQKQLDVPLISSGPKPILGVPTPMRKKPLNSILFWSITVSEFVMSGNNSQCCDPSGHLQFFPLVTEQIVTSGVGGGVLPNVMVKFKTLPVLKGTSSNTPNCHTAFGFWRLLILFRVSSGI